MSAATPAPRRAYLDHSSTSPLRPAAAAAMLAWLSGADPARVHTEGRMARAALEDARSEVARLLGTRPRQVIFTSGATESVNAAVYGAVAAHPDRRLVVMAEVEHSAVREASRRWAGGVLAVPVEPDGTIVAEAVAEAVGRGGDGSGAGRTGGEGRQGEGSAGGDGARVGLVHCQLANHEVGTLQPVAQVAEICRRHGVLLHVDAAAGAGHVPIDFDTLGADLLSLSAHTLGGPKGVGALLVRRGLRVPPLLLGGAQERARRGGLENLPAAAGFGAVAAELSAPGVLQAESAAAAGRTARLRELAVSIGGVDVYGPDDPGRRLPNLVCMGVSGVEAEPVLIGLDQAGVAAHSGSSCSSETLEPSPVLAAMGVDADHSLRLSVGWSTTDADIDRAVETLPRVVARLRALRAGAGGR